MFREKPKEEDRYAFDDSIFKPNEEVRLRLPEEEEVVYEEVQTFDQIWLWAIMGIQLLVVMIPLILTGQSWWTVVLAIGAIVLGMALLGSLNLKTRIDTRGVHYRMKVFHWKEQTIPWEEIDQIYVRKYSPIGEYGGWGIRFGRGGRAYNVMGTYGIQVIKKNGKRILLGTQKQDEAALFLSQHPLLV